VLGIPADALQVALLPWRISVNRAAAGARPPTGEIAYLDQWGRRFNGGPMNLTGKVALVTGASRGVGAATAVALAQSGCRWRVRRAPRRRHPRGRPARSTRRWGAFARRRRGHRGADHLAAETEVGKWCAPRPRISAAWTCW
jgi:hypothetical protein